MTSLEREVLITPGYDLRGKGPRNYGIAGCTIFFYVKGPHGVIQCSIMTDWYLQSARGTPAGHSQQNKPWITDIGYHAKEPQYEGHTKMTNCHLLEECYYDGTSLNEKWEEGLINEGTKWLWPRLEQLYRSRFEDGEYPDLIYNPVQYPEGDKADG